jgi:hypothetical protein
MKCLSLSLLLVLFISCNDEPQPSTATKKPITLAPIKKDSGFTKREAANPYSAIDISPVDIAYFPTDYPITKMSGNTAQPVARVIYSRPHKQGRTIFGNLLKYGEPWRLGANEATEIELFQPVSIQNKTIPKGRYILYCIPKENKWTVVFNSNTFSWGLKQDAGKDLFRFDIPVERTHTPIEYFTITFEKTGTGANLLMAWDEVVARLPINF